MSQEKTKQPKYGMELKLAAVRRVLAGESVSAVAQELSTRRKRLYVWKDRYAELGEAGLVHGVEEDRGRKGRLQRKDRKQGQARRQILSRSLRKGGRRCCLERRF